MMKIRYERLTDCSQHTLWRMYKAKKVVFEKPCKSRQLQIINSTISPLLLHLVLCSTTHFIETARKKKCSLQRMQQDV